MVLTALLIFFLFCVLVQCFYYIYYFSAIGFYTNGKRDHREFPVSVIIAARNEEHNIQQYLPVILDQNYKNYEVIVVNDHSTDSTMSILNAFRSEKLKIVDLQEKKGKKAAIEHGIENAKSEWLLFTDADCKVNSQDWIKSMLSNLNEQTEIVIGHARFFREKGFLNKLVRFESLLNALQSFSFAVRGKAYTAIGRNMAYKKELFLRSSSFEKHTNLISGDDDLIVNEMARKGNAVVSLDELSHTLTKAESTFLLYFKQRRRQLQAGAKYKILDKIRLALFGATNFMYYLLFVILVITYQYTSFILGIFVLKQVIQFVVFNNSLKKLGDRDLVKWIPVLEPIYMFIIAVVGISTWVRKVDKWK